MANNCYQAWYPPVTRLKIPGWPRPGTPRVQGPHFQTGSARLNALAHTWYVNGSGGITNPIGVGYTFTDSLACYLYLYFIEAGLSPAFLFPWYWRFDMVHTIEQPSGLSFWSMTGYEWDADHWDEMEQTWMGGTQFASWENLTRLVVKRGSTVIAQGNQWNNVEPDETMEPTALPSSGPPGFPWPVPPAPTFN